MYNHGKFINPFFLLTVNKKATILSARAGGTKNTNICHRIQKIKTTTTAQKWPVKPARKKQKANLLDKM